ELTAEYWVRNLREPVRFAPVIEQLAGTGHGVFIEASPHPVLTVAIGESLDQTSGFVTGTLRRDEGGPCRLLLSLAEAWTHGAGVDWARLIPAGARTVPLPTYPFQGTRFWLDPANPARGEAGPGRYRIAWRPADITGQPAPLSGSWLLITSAGTPAEDVDRCRQALAAAGAEVRTVEIDTSQPGAALAQQWDTAEAPSGVVSLLALDPQLELGATLALVQAHVAAEHLAAEDRAAEDVAAAHPAEDLTAERSLPLWCLTRGAVAATADDLPEPGQAAVWGLGRVVALEHPRHWGGLIDLPAGWTERTGTDLAAALTGLGRDEDQLALRSGGVLTRRLVPAPPESIATPWTPAGTVLVTGTGGIAARVARWLLHRGAEHVALAGPVGGPSGDPSDLTDLGDRVSCTGADPADRAALADLLARLAAQGRPVRALVHAAAGTTLAPVERVTPAELAASRDATVAPAAVALDLLPGLEAGYLFTSVSGVWGTGQHAAFAAANAELDALAAQARSRGVPVAGLTWSIWRTPATAAAGADRQGVPLLDPDQALATLAGLGPANAAGLVLAEVDWSRFAELFTSVRSSRLLVEVVGEPEPASVAASDTGFAERLAGLPVGERRRVVLELVTAHVAAVSGRSGAGAVEVSRPFKDLGFDSLIAVELRNRLTAATGLALPPTLVYDHPTPGALADHLLDQLGAADRLTPSAVRDRLKALEDAVTAADFAPADRRAVAAQLAEFVQRWQEDPVEETGFPATTGAVLDEADDDELFDFIHRELGRPAQN
ncbi:MAG TPA: KR domain-containing protein, partial [Jatrophihabitans sp.]|nr:KR domain-containing protein [Jatrophihabitans sp.]